MIKKNIIPYSVNDLHISPELAEVQDDMKIDLKDYNNLKKDIQETGEIRDPIKVYFDNKGTALILGGMNRLRVAQELSWDTVPIEILELNVKDRERFVILDNLSRRQLDSNSRILLQARIWADYYKKEMKGRPAKGDTVTPFIDDIQEKTGLSKRTIQREKKIFQKAKEKALNDGKEKPSKQDIEKVRKQENDNRKNKRNNFQERLQRVLELLTECYQIAGDKEKDVLRAEVLRVIGNF